MNSRDILEHCLDSSRHALSDAKDSRPLYVQEFQKTVRGLSTCFIYPFKGKKYPRYEMCNALCTKHPTGEVIQVMTWKGDPVAGMEMSRCHVTLMELGSQLASPYRRSLSLSTNFSQEKI